jgi:hypothetical protein
MQREFARALALAFHDAPRRVIPSSLIPHAGREINEIVVVCPGAALKRPLCRHLQSFIIRLLNCHIYLLVYQKRQYCWEPAPKLRLPKALNH